MVMHGMESTVPVTLDMMILQGQAVMRGSKRALVVVDLPFGAYEESREQAFRSAARILKETGCGAIKLEGGARMAETIRFLTERGVPVMGHVGLTPQSINTLGSFKAQGRDRADWPVFLADAKAVAEAGAFRVVVEAVAEPLGREITAGGRHPDHRHRRLGRLRRADPGARGHARPDARGRRNSSSATANSGPHIAKAVEAYAQEVRSRAFPGPEHTYRGAEGRQVALATVERSQPQSSPRLRRGRVIGDPLR